MTRKLLAQHKSFHSLLEKAKESCTPCFIPSPTGSSSLRPANRGKRRKICDSPGSETITLRVRTEKGLLERTARTSRHSIEQWVLKPWIDSSADLDKFLSLPFSPFVPDISDLKEKEREYGELTLSLLPIPTPVGVAGTLFAPGEFAQFLLQYPKKIEALLDKLFDRLVPTYQYLSQNLMNVVFRVRGSEYLTPPVLPPDIFLITEYLSSVFCRSV